MTITKWEEAKKIIKKSNIVYLWFGTDWCGDCVMMEPIVEELKNFFSDDNNITFLKVDAEESLLFQDEKSEYKVMKIPTHIFLKKGEIMNIEYEYFPLELMIKEIEKLK